MRNSTGKKVAFGGVFGAVAMVIMCLGGLIPGATFAIPVLCTLICAFISGSCGDRIGWAWYGAVSILSVLMAPDKEAAAIFVFLGYYPMLKTKLDKTRGKHIWKFLYFNAVILIMYALLIYMFGMTYLITEFSELGFWGLAVMLVLGNVIFLVVDLNIGRLPKKFKKSPGL